jgi:hypothetical protein
MANYGIFLAFRFILECEEYNFSLFDGVKRSSNYNSSNSKFTFLIMKKAKNWPKNWSRKPEEEQFSEKMENN